MHLSQRRSRHERARMSRTWPQKIRMATMMMRARRCMRQGLTPPLDAAVVSRSPLYNTSLLTCFIILIASPINAFPHATRISSTRHPTNPTLKTCTYRNHPEVNSNSIPMRDSSCRVLATRFLLPITRAASPNSAKTTGRK